MKKKAILLFKWKNKKGKYKTNQKCLKKKKEREILYWYVKRNISLWNILKYFKAMIYFRIRWLYMYLIFIKQNSENRKFNQCLTSLNT